MFIVDQEYDSRHRKEEASKVINKFFDSLQDTDYFGFIGLGEDSEKYEIKLEPKGFNCTVKKKILKSEKILNTSLSVHDKQLF